MNAQPLFQESVQILVAKAGSKCFAGWTEGARRRVEREDRIPKKIERRQAFRHGLVSMLDIMIPATLIVIAIFGIGLVFATLYTRSTRDQAYVRTGLGGQKVVIDGGSIVLPASLQAAISTGSERRLGDSWRKAMHQLAS